jgi:acyl dehydratase
MVEAITTLDEFEAEYRKGIGTNMDLNHERFLYEATRDNILNFADAIGDNNPLWTNEEYARKNRFGEITGPPTFLYNFNHGSTPVNIGTITQPVRNISLLYSGAEFEFFRPVRLGDRFTITGKPTTAVRKSSKAVGSLLFVTGEASYVNQAGQLAGVLRTTICHYETPKERAIDFDRQARPEVVGQSPDILAFDRKRRGNQTRYWEDVEVGEQLTDLEKGVLTMTEISRFGIMVSPQPRRIQVRREAVELGFAREAQQKRAGLENASDYGPQRICWLGQIVTDWMGDDGALRKLSGQIRHPNIIGDVNVVKGKVARKYISDGEHLVDCELRVENQAGLITAPGGAVVALPSRTK